MNERVRLLVIVLVFVGAGFLIWKLPDLLQEIPSDSQQAQESNQDPEDWTRPGGPSAAEVRAERQRTSRQLSRFEGIERAGGAIEGTVIDKAGAPVPHAAISAVELVGPAETASLASDRPFTAKADGAGAFRLEKLPLSNHFVRATTDGLAGVTYARLSHSNPTATTNIVVSAAKAIEGRVQDEQRRPIPDVLVACVYGDTESMMYRSNDANMPRSLNARTAPDGTFKLMVPDGHWQLAAKASGYATHLTESIPAGATDVWITLHEGGTVTGRVVEADTGEPVSRVPVRIQARDLGPDITSVVSGSGGAFRAEGLRKGVYHLSVNTGRMITAGGPVTAELARGETLDGVEVPIERACVVMGRVYDAYTREGIPGVEIIARPSFEGGYVPGLEVQTARTSMAGFYRLDGLGRTHYTISRGKTPGYPDGTFQMSHTVAARPGEIFQRMDFPVERGITVTGRVVDEADGPVEGATVSATGVRYSTTTEEDGTFELVGLQAGEQTQIRAEKNGKLATPYGPFTVPPEGRDGILLELDQQRDGVIAGVVVDAEGRPLQGVRVWTAPADRQGSARWDYSGQDGQFRVEGLVRKNFNLFYRFESVNISGMYRDADLSSAPRLENLRLVLEAAANLGHGEISGQVTDEAGMAVVDMTVHASGQRLGFSAHTDGQGRYALKNLPDGAYDLTISDKQYIRASRSGVRAGSVNVDFVLKFRGSIEGRVIEAGSRKPVTRYRIAYLNEPGIHFNPTDRHQQQEYVQVIHPDGAFYIRGAEPGPSSLIVDAPGFEPTTKELTVPKAGGSVSGVEIVLPRADVINGVVVDARRNLLPGVWIYAGDLPESETALGGQRLTETNQRGEFQLNFVPDGTTRLSAYHPAYLPGSVPVPENRDRQAVIELQQAGALRGRVTMGGEAFTDGRIAPIEAIPPRGQISAETDHDGEYLLQGLPPGEIEVKLWYTVEAPTEQQPNQVEQVEVQRTVRIQPGETATLDFRL